MSSIHYKFSSSNEFKHVTFDGLSVSLLDLKKAIMEKQKLKSTELDLHITNAQTLQVYKDESALIPKNAAVLVRRIPLGPVRDSKIYVVKRNESSVASSSPSAKAYHENDAAPKLSFAELTKTSNLAAANASEDDKIKAAIAQSTNEYDPSHFVRPPRYGTYKYPTSSSAIPSQVRCFRCNQQGHYSSQCPLPKTEAARQHHHATGIPRSHMIEVNKESKGAMLTADGRYVVPVMDKKGYDIGKKERPPFVPVVAEPTQEEDEDEPIPDELICLLCKDLLVNAVVIPCCGNSYCDECIRNALLDSESHQCPTCHKANISPDSLIANKFLRQAVNKFKNDTGIAKKRSNAPVWPRPASNEAPKTKQTPPIKVSYGPSSRDHSSEPRQTGNSAYVVKATSNQVVAPKAYNLSKRPLEGGGGSPRDPGQPIRIKLGKSDDPVTDGGSKEATPSEPVMQSTPIDGESLPSSTPSGDSYTFNSTPDSNEHKVKANTSEPLPPGISPPTVKVVRPLMEETSSKVDQPPGKLTGIRPLHLPTEDSDVQPAEEFKDFTIHVEHQPKRVVEPTTEGEVEKNGLQQISDATQEGGAEQEGGTEQEDDAKLEDVVKLEDDAAQKDDPEEGDDTKPSVSVETEMNSPAQQDENGPDLVDSAPARHDGDDAPSPDSQPNPTPTSVPAPPLAVNRQVLRAHTTVTPPPPQNSLPLAQNVPPLANIPLLPPIHLPPPTSMPNLAIPPPSQAVPGLVPGLPPLLHQVPKPDASMFQRPPPPFPFPMGIPPPAGPTPFSQPPPGFPAYPGPLRPPPGMAIPSLGKAVSISAVMPPPPGSEAALIPAIKTSAPSERAPHHRGRSPRNERSPRKRTDRRGNKSKLDIMSDEFAEKLKQRSSPRRRSRSSSRSYSSKSSQSGSYSSYASSRSPSSYSSYSASSWTSSSYSRSPSRTPPPRRKRKRHAQRATKGRRRGSASWSDMSPSPRKKRRSRSYSRKKQSRRERSPQKRSRKSERSYSPQRKSGHPGRERRRSFERGRKSFSPRRNESDAGRPLIPVITRGDPVIPGLPTKEAADYERDQALYAHYRQTYERDWYERGIMPPPPYDRFIQSRYSKSPSPPGTGPTILPLIQPPIQNSVLINPLGVLPPQGPPHAPPSYEVEGYPWNYQRIPPPRHVEQTEPGRRPVRLGDDGNYYDDHPPRMRNVPSGFRGVDPKEEQYRMQLSPRSRQRFDVERQQQRQHREARGRADYPRDNRYVDERRRNVRDNYDDYRGRKRGRNYPRDVSPDRGMPRMGRRNKASPRADVEDGDGTPVRDERPPPDDMEAMDWTRFAGKRGGDVVKSGKKPRREERKVGSERGKDLSKPDRKESQSKRTQAKSSRADKSESLSKSSKRKVDQTTESIPKAKKSASTKRSKSSKSSKTEESRAKEKIPKARPDKPSSSKSYASKQESAVADVAPMMEEGAPPSTEATNGSAADSDHRVLVPLESASSVPVEVIKASKNKKEGGGSVKEMQEEPEEPSRRAFEGSSESSTKPAQQDGEEQNKTTSKDKSTKSSQKVKTTSSGKAPQRPPSLEKVKIFDSEAKSEEQEGARVAQSIKRKQELKQDSRKVSRKRRPPPAIGSPSESEGRLSQAERRKLVEYDGSGPAPTGDELVKITIPKSKWEKSDDEGKDASHRIVRSQEGKAAGKGRRIRIKRNPPPVKEKAKEVKADEPHSEIKKVTKSVEKEPITDARMVITLRRNSKQSTEREGRRVSMGNPDEAHFEPDYNDEVAEDHSGSPGKSVMALKGKAVKVAAMRSTAPEDADALVLSDYSNFSNTESDKIKKAAKKKKKKKKKHKNRSQDSAEADDDVYKTTSTLPGSPGDDVKDDDERANRRRHRGGKERMRRHKHGDDEDISRQKTRKHAGREMSPDEHYSRERNRRSPNRDRHERHHDDRHRHNRDHSRNHESRHDEKKRDRDSPERSRDKPRDKKRKKEKRARRRRESLDGGSPDPP